MAKSQAKAKKVEAEEIENEDGAEGTEGKAGGRRIMLTLEDGTEISRADYIRQRADEGAPRGTIAKELTKLQGKTVPYQIVFAATKDHPTYKKGKGGDEE